MLVAKTPSRSHVPVAALQAHHVLMLCVQRPAYCTLCTVHVALSWVVLHRSLASQLQSTLPPLPFLFAGTTWGWHLRM